MEYIMDIQNETENSSLNAQSTKDYLQVVTFKLHDEEYAIEITKAKEIILVEGVTHVPQMPDFIEGIINLRGNVIPVIDLRKRFGLAQTALGDQARIVVTRMDSRIIGLIVDSVSQVIKIPLKNIQPPPDTIAHLAGEYLVSIGKIDNKMILILDIEKVFTINQKNTINNSDNKSVQTPVLHA
jgi:purine-binding chemotaxis protein CheW